MTVGKPPYVRGENHFQIADESPPDQVHQWAEDWFNLWTLEVCHTDKSMRRVERFIDCSSRLAAVAELHSINAAPLLTFIRELGEAWLAGPIPSRSDSHLGEAQDVVERVDSWAKGNIVQRNAAKPAPHGAEVGGKPKADRDGTDDEPVQSGGKSKRRGRLPKTESDAKRAHMLATLRQHPSLKEDVGKLARMVEIGESTVRRWIEEEEQKYRESKVARPEPAEE